MYNTVFGKTNENVWQNIVIKLVTSEKGEVI